MTTTTIDIQTPMKEAKRRPGSEWLKNHPRILELVYDGSKKVLQGMYPVMKRISPSFTEKFMIWNEKSIKGYVFNCQMCGQCILHSTGMTCPMNCPKNLRNGPCGGVRANGHCEVIPEMPCVWVQAWGRSQDMGKYKDELQMVQPPVNRTLQDTSAWINMFEEIDQQPQAGWVEDDKMMG